MTIGTQAYLQGYMHEKTAAWEPRESIKARFKQRPAPPPITMSPAPTGKERIAARDEYLERNRINNYTENLVTPETSAGWGPSLIPGSDPSEARFKYDRARLYRDPKAYEEYKRRFSPSGSELPGYREGGVPSLETRTTAGLKQPRQRYGAARPATSSGDLSRDDIKRMYPQK